MGDAIVRSVETARGDDTRVPAVVLLLSDGANTEGLTEPLDAADQARQANVAVFTIALGYDKERREITLAFVGAGILLLLAGGTLSALWFNRLP